MFTQQLIREGKQITIAAVSNGYIVTFPVAPVDYSKAIQGVASNLLKQDRLGLNIEQPETDEMFKLSGLIPRENYLDYSTKVFTSLDSLLTFLRVQFDDQ